MHLQKSNVPNMRHLRMVSLLVRGETLNRTASLLSVSQPSLTLALSRLEDHFGVELFNRGSSRLVTTQAGTALARRIDRAFGCLWNGLRDSNVRWAMHVTPDGTSDRIPVDLILRHLSATRIRALDAIARCADLAEAADTLGITPPSLRRTLSHLQEATGIRIFSDSGIRCALTPTAQILAGSFRLALRELELATDDLNDLQGVVGGFLSVGVAPVAGTVLLPVTIGKLMTHTPQARIRVASDDEEKMIAAVCTGHLDFFCGTYDRAMPPNLTRELLYIGELRILARSGHPLHEWPGEVPASELQRYPWLAPEARSGAAFHFRQIFETEGLTPPVPAMDIRPGEQACNLLRKSDFLALASRPVGMEPDELPGLWPLHRAMPESERPVWLIWRTDGRPTTLHRLFRQMVLDEARSAATLTIPPGFSPPGSV